MLLDIKKMKINDEITYDVKNYCIIYNFDESGIIKSYTISKPTENEKDRIYEFFNGFHDWFLKQIHFDSDSKALCIEIISDDRSQTICELQCEGVTNMMLPVESPWNTRTLYINMAFIEGDSLGVNDTLRMYKSDDIRMYNFDCITDTIVEVITTCNTYTLLTVHLL